MESNATQMIPLTPHANKKATPGGMALLFGGGGGNRTRVRK
jgi:hypothetical protein